MSRGSSVEKRLRWGSSATQPTTNNGDDYDLESRLNRSYVTREFDQAFRFLQAKAEAVSADEDAIDSELKHVMLDLMEGQRK